MSDPDTTQPDEFISKTQETLQAMKDITGANAQISAHLAGVQETHIATCAALLQTSLDAAALDIPQPALDLVRERFTGKVFTAPELKKELDAFRTAFAQQSAAAAIVGPAQVTGMFTREDQLQAAMDDLLGAPREDASKSLKVHKFNGIREAYVMLSNDFNFTGDVDARLAKFQGSTATFPNLVANALNKAIVDNWNKLGAAGYNWWEKIVTVEPFETLNTITWLRLGTISSLPSVSEGAEYPELPLGDNGETSTFVKYGGYLSFTLEAMDRDDTRKLRAAPREIASAALRNISEQIAAIFTTASAAGPTLADGGALFNATAVTTKGGHKNLLTTALGTDYTAWNAAATAVYDQPLLVSNAAGINVLTYGKKQALEPTICLIPRALKSQAESLFIKPWDTKVQSIPSNGGPTYAGNVMPVVVPEWTDATDWAAIVDPAILPGIMIGTRYGLIPQIVLSGSATDPSMFMNDESRLKVRHFLATGIGNWSALHKSNVAG